MTSRGFCVGALAAVNSVGRATRGESLHFWAGSYERDGEFGGLGFGPKDIDDALALRLKSDTPSSSDLAVVVTDAALTKTQLKRVAMMAQDGFALALRPAHTPWTTTCLRRRNRADARRARPSRLDRDRPHRRRMRRPRRRPRRLRGLPALRPRRAADMETAAGDEFKDEMSRVCRARHASHPSSVPARRRHSADTPYGVAVKRWRRSPRAIRSKTTASLGRLPPLKPGSGCRRGPTRSSRLS